MNDHTMQYRHDVPSMAEGLTLDQIWFCGGRIGVRLAKHGGISAITYYGQQPLDRPHFFHGDGVSAWVKIFRLCLVVDGTVYYPNFSRTELHPFGYRSQGSAGGVTFRHDLVLLNDSLVQRVAVMRNPRRATLALRLIWHGHPAWVSTAHRTWSPFTIDSDVAVAVAREDIPPEVYQQWSKAKSATLTQCDSFGVHDIECAETHIAVAADRGVTFQNLNRNFKFHADTARFTDRAAFMVTFAWNRTELDARVTNLRRDLHRQCDARFAEAASLGKRQPSFTLGRPVVESFLAQLPAVVDALRVGDVPGAMRASAGHYWVWGWDSMVYSKGLMFAGRGAFVAQMLELYRGLADATRGIPHCLTTTFAPLMAMASTAQTLYAVMLYNHYCVSRNLKVLREYFPFARQLVERALAGEVRDSGLVDGPSLFPDHPELVGHDGHDLSVFNNSIFYQALLCLRDLARVLGDADDDAPLRSLAESLTTTAERCRSGFSRTFFDAQAGYFIDSASSVDFTPRRHHPGYAILWLTAYARDLVAEELPRIAAFMARELTAPRGVLHFPVRDQQAYLSDGNQATAGYPVIEPFYWNVMSLAGRGRELARWTDNVTWFWDTNTIPEGLTYDAINAGDVVADCPGGKQPFAGKAWYELFFTAYAGIDVDIDGLVLRPTPITTPLRVRNLVIAGKRIDLSIRGRGGKSLSITLNGRRLGTVARIPLTALRPGTNRISALRSSRSARQSTPQRSCNCTV